MLELPILGLLKEGPMHGYELKKRLDETFGWWGVSYGSLYPALARLERSGAIEAVEPYESPRRFTMPATGSLSGEAAAARTRRLALGPRRRKAYQITGPGHDLFQDLFDHDAPTAPDDDRAFALKLVFCRYLPREARIRILERRRVQLAERLERAHRTLQRHLTSGATSYHHASTEGSDASGLEPDLYARSVAEHGTRSMARDLEWIDELLAAERARGTSR